MTSGMRRPPRLWEQKLEKMIRSAGVTGLGGASSIVVTPGPTPGPDGPGSEPAPPPVVDPSPGTPRVPSTPVVAGTTLGLTVIWDGKDSTGIIYPSGTTVEVHVSASTGFTPSSSTLKGVISEAGGSLLVGGISAGATFYVRFIAVYPDGQKSGASAEGSAMVGLVQGPDINGDAVITQIVAATTPVTTYKLGSIWINTSNGTYNVLQSVGGVPTWVKREWDTAAIAANAITANQIAAQAITAKLVSGEVIRTTTVDSGARVRITSADGVEVFGPSGRVFQASPTGTVTITGYQVAGSYLTATDVGSGGSTIIDGGRITSGTIVGRTIESSNATNRVQLSNGNQLLFYSSNAVLARLYTSGGDFLLDSADDFVFGNTGNSNTGTDFVKFIDKGGASGHRLTIGDFNDPDAIYLDTAEVRMRAVNDQESANAANVRIGGDTVDYRLARATSTVRIKDELVSLGDELKGVPAEKLADFSASIDPYDVLTVSPTEFRSLCDFDGGARILGFVAEDVAEKLPWATYWDSDGVPSGVEDRPILAALLCVVRDQQSVIEDLRNRIEALER